MSIQTSYPIFESGQVLTSSHLNDLVEYLEEQDRLTRNKLIGVGIVCGLEPSYEAQQNQIRISPGCAVTSEGYLITLAECVLNQFRDYTLPVPKLEEADEEIVEESKYPFFLGQNGEQIELWELLPTDHVPNPGEEPTEEIDAAFLADKVVLLFLECHLQSLKNCDINDCSDKGSELEFNVRKLLISKDDAIAILQQEEEIAERPVDRHNHPRYDLKEIQIEKINPSAHQIDNFTQLLFRIVQIAGQVAPDLTSGLKDGYSAYKYLLADIYPDAQFPNGPFGNPGYFSNVLAQLVQNLFLAQYFYDYLYDVVQSHNEFLRAACLLEAECCPNPERFPRHVLLGEPKQRPAAFSTSFTTVADVLAFDPAGAETGLGPATRPAAFRHHFIPSPIFEGRPTRLQEVRSLHYRTYLLAYRYSTRGRLTEPIRITPSKDGDYELSAKSVPFYYEFKFEDDLHRNWSFHHTVKNRLPQVFSHQFMNSASHPLRNKMDGHSFYRVEGIVGKSLGQVMSELLDQKRKLGLSFGIEPVFIGLTQGNDLSSLALNKEAKDRATAALIKLLLCRMRDLDVVFLILIASLFFYLFAILKLLVRVSTLELAGMTAETPAPPVSGLLPVIGRILSRRAFEVDRVEAEAVFKTVRGARYQKGALTGRLVDVDDPRKSIGRLYAEIQEQRSSTNLFDRTLEFARGLDPNIEARAAAQKIYPAVSLIDQTESLIETVSSPTLAEFDFAQFQERFSGFSQSFDAYMAEVAESPAPAGSQIESVNQALAGHYEAVASTGPKTVVSNLGTELQKRLGNLFEELTLEGYAKRHPGMEHKAGVPRAGTLILLYTHKGFLAEILKGAAAEIESKVTEALTSLGASTLPIQDPEKILKAIVPTSDDELRDFVVLADFCVPYLCCDSDCSDIELKPVDSVPAEPAVVKGSVFGRRTQGANPQLIRNAEVRVVDLERNTDVSVQVENGTFAFTGPAGTYRIDAGAPRFLPASRTITVAAGSQRTEDVILDVRG